MDNCCANCKWRETEHITGDCICGNQDSEWCTDQVGDDWHCDGWEVKENG